MHMMQGLCPPQSAAGPSPLARSPTVFHPAGLDGVRVRGSGGFLKEVHPSAPLGTRAPAHETAAALQKPITEAPGPPRSRT